MLRTTWAPIIALATYAFLATEVVFRRAGQGHPEAILALAAVPIGYYLRDRPVLLGLAMAIGGVWLRLLSIGPIETSDQLTVSRAALNLVLAGGNPYGHGYAESVPPGAPFPYGPLGLLTGAMGVPGEIVASVGLMVLLARTRSLVTLAWFAAGMLSVELGLTGDNDQVPALLILAGLLALERHRITGAVLIATSAAIKPYGFAWFPAAFGYGGLATIVALIGASAVLWSPLLVWGPGTYLTTVEMARSIHLKAENSLDMPALRILAAPLALASLLVHSWWLMVASGVVIFIVVMFLDRWASLGYWYVVLPLVGLLAERGSRLLKEALVRQRAGTA
jgi:hypothetical protein